MKAVCVIIAGLWLGAAHSVLLRSPRILSSSSLGFLHSQQCDSKRYFVSPSPSRLFGSVPGKSNDGESKNKSTKDKGDAMATTTTWELMEDWVLQDRVPDFTVRGGTTTASTTATIATFWRQLKHTIPELSTRTEAELEDRYNILATKAASSDTITTSPQTGDNQKPMETGTPFIECGTSPEVLTNWWMDVVERKAGNSNNSNNNNSDDSSPSSAATIMMMHGRLSNGSNIWFPLQSAGTVGSPSALGTKTGYSWLLEEGDYIKYVESPAGCIYELGLPKPDSSQVRVDNDTQNTEPNLLAGSPGALLDRTQDFLSSSSKTGTMIFAVVASSLLSASLAFFAGQASQSSPPPAPPTPPAPIVRQLPSQAVTPAVLGSGMKYERTVLRDGSVKTVELTLPEQRASQELRVYREERRLTGLREKLQADKATLVELRAQEARMGPVAANENLVDVPRSPRELPVSEQRARAELKIGVDNRRIKRLEESLVNEKAKLKVLQAEERQQKGLFFK